MCRYVNSYVHKQFIFVVAIPIVGNEISCGLILRFGWLEKISFREIENANMHLFQCANNFTKTQVHTLYMCIFDGSSLSTYFKNRAYVDFCEFFLHTSFQSKFESLIYLVILNKWTVNNISN